MTLLLVILMILVGIMAVLAFLGAVIPGHKAIIRFATSQANLAASPTACPFEKAPLEFDPKLKELFACGTYGPYAIVSTGGLYKVKISKKWEAFALLAERSGVNGSTGPSLVWLGYYPEGYVSGRDGYEMSGYCGKWKMDIGSGDVHGEDVDFHVLTFTKVTLP